MENIKEKLINCNIVRDLLPVYCDGQASEDSVQAVRQHLSECGECKKVYKDMVSVDELFETDSEEGSEDKEIDVFKKVKLHNRLKVILGVVVTAIVCIIAFVVLFIGVIPLNSKDVTVTYEIYRGELEVADQNDETEKIDTCCVEFHFELKDGKVLVCRSNEVRVIKLFGVCKLPFDDRGTNSNMYDYGIESVEPFTEEDVITIQFRDKIITYNLKQLVDESGKF